jgi:hypothetical protein
MKVSLHALLRACRATCEAPIKAKNVSDRTWWKEWNTFINRQWFFFRSPFSRWLNKRETTRTFPNVCTEELTTVFRTHSPYDVKKHKRVSLRSGGTNTRVVLLSSAVLSLQYRLLFNGYQASFPGVKRPGRDVDHSPPFSDEVKNG